MGSLILTIYIQKRPFSLDTQETMIYILGFLLSLFLKRRALETLYFLDIGAKRHLCIFAYDAEHSLILEMILNLTAKYLCVSENTEIIKIYTPILSSLDSKKVTEI